MLLVEYRKLFNICKFHTLKQLTMKKIGSIILLLCIVAIGYSQVQSNVFKNIYRGNSDTLKVNLSPTSINGSGSLKKSAQSTILQTNYINAFSKNDTSVVVKYSSNTNLPFFIETKRSSKKAATSDTVACFEFLHSVKNYTRVLEPEKNFYISSIHYDKNDNAHFRFHQKYKGIEVYGSDFYVHLKKEKEQFTGNYHVIDTHVDLQARITDHRAIEIALNDLKKKTAINELNNLKNGLLAHSEPNVKLVIKQSEGLIGSYNLVYMIHVKPNFFQEWVYFIDAKTGSIVRCYDNTKDDAPASAEAYDLNNVLRPINTSFSEGIYYLKNISEAMYDEDRDEGHVRTYDCNGQLTEPLTVTSLDNNWDNKAAVSAHYSATTAYKYFYETFGRNSINAQGCNIECFVNFPNPEDGGGYDNAHWADGMMIFGNGRDLFKNLAGGLDVVAHEMGHGVIQNTANLEYYGVSGAINETFADIFGAMVDRDDWFIGEDISKSTVPMRDMSDPQACGQPSHMSEFYITEDDKGGVHTNSGIGNHAYYLYATSVTKETAEQVFYHSLKNYLTSHANFIDLRIAVIQSATDLYGEYSNEVLRAEIAFDAVGIYDDEGNNYFQDYPANTGNQYLCYYDLDHYHPSTFYASDIVGDNPVGLTNYLANSRLSLKDDGTVGIYVSSINTIHSIDLTTLDDIVIQDQPIWANAVISKDGNRLAAVTTVSDTAIWVYDFNLSEWAKFDLYNPTTSHDNENSKGVVFADALEFDVTGEYIVYDAYNVKLTDGGYDSIAYWDIGFINVWDNQTGNFGDGTIKKLYGTLPDNTSIGNPTFSKNSPYIIAFDYYDNIDNLYAIFGSNIYTGVTDIITLNNDIGYPSFTKDDDVIVFSALDGGEPVVEGIILESNKISTSELQSPVNLVKNAKWGVCFADGVRNLGLPPIANFTASYKSGKAPLNVQFFDNSINDPTSWSWIFEGGTPASSTDQNPVVTYATEGVYEVTLVVVNSFGDDTLSRQSYINVVATSLVVNTSSLEMSSDASSTTSFTITSNTDWSISGLESWLSANTTSGTGNATITLTADENTSTESRTAMLTISGTGVSDQSVTVTQSGVAVVFSVSETSLNIDADANSTASFNITTNTDWSITISESWLSASSYAGSEDATINLTAEENNSTEPRTANTTVSGFGATDHVITVTQDGITGMNNPEISDIILYPIPVTSILYFEGLHNISRVKVFDIMGKKVIDTQVSQNLIDVSGLQTGFYTIKLNFKADVLIKNFVKQ